MRSAEHVRPEWHPRGMPRRLFPRPVSAGTLRAMSEHVLHEIHMFGLMTDLLTPHLWAEATEYMAQGAHNAMVESFTIHARALQDSLYAKPRGDNASAGDWFPPGSGSGCAALSRKCSSRSRCRSRVRCSTRRSRARPRLGRGSRGGPRHWVVRRRGGRVGRPCDRDDAHQLPAPPQRRARRLIVDAACGLFYRHGVRAPAWIRTPRRRARAKASSTTSSRASRTSRSRSWRDLVYERPKTTRTFAPRSRRASSAGATRSPRAWSAWPTPERFLWARIQRHRRSCC
jgi:hypothetical protein